MRGIIIDGVAASGKSSILRLFQKKLMESKPNMTKIFLSEHYTERMLEHLKEDGTLNGYHISDHVDKIIGTLNVFQKMLSESKFKDEPRGADAIAILERFILTHFASLEIEDTYGIELAKKHFQTLNSMGIIQIALIIPRDKLKDRIISTISYRNDAWKEYLFSKGSEEDIISGYQDWQDRFIRYLNEFKSSIKTFEIEVKDDNYDSYSEQIFNKIFN